MATGDSSSSPCGRTPIRVPIRIAMVGRTRRTPTDASAARPAAPRVCAAPFRFLAVAPSPHLPR